MTRTIPLLIGCLLIVPASAAAKAVGDGRNPEAVRILEKVDAAVKSIDAVRCRGTVTPTGVATDFTPQAEGEAYLKGWAGSMPARFFARVRIHQPDSGEEVELTGGGDGDSYFVIDHNTKKGYEDMDPGVLGSRGQSLLTVCMVEFVHEQPFDDELEAPTLELLEETEVGGEPCHQIRVVYSGGRGESIWFFSKNDFLPRRRLQKFSIPQQGEGTIDRVVTKLEIAPTVDPKRFKMQLPEGYETIDDFAP